MISQIEPRADRKMQLGHWKKLNGKGCRQDCFDAHFRRVRSNPQPPPQRKRSFKSRIAGLESVRLQTLEHPHEQLENVQNLQLPKLNH